MAINYELMARQAEIRKQKEEEEKRKSGQLGNILLGAAAAYLTAGLAPALLGGAASLAPTATTVLPAIGGGMKGAGAKDTTEAVVGGVQAGAEQTATDWAATQLKAKSEAARRIAEEKLTKEGLIKGDTTVSDAGELSSKWEKPTLKLKLEDLPKPSKGYQWSSNSDGAEWKQVRLPSLGDEIGKEAIKNEFAETQSVLRDKLTSFSATAENREETILKLREYETLIDQTGFDQQLKTKLKDDIRKTKAALFEKGLNIYGPAPTRKKYGIIGPEIKTSTVEGF